MTSPTPDPIDQVAAYLTVATDATAPADLRETARHTAAQLMARHDITPAAARAACGTRHSRLTIATHPVPGTDGHGEARATILIGIAEALHCKGIHQPAPAPHDYGVVLLGTAAEVRAARRLTDGIFADIDNTFPAGDPELPEILTSYGKTTADAIRRRYESPEMDPTHQTRLTALLAARFTHLDTITFDPDAHRPTTSKRGLIRQLIDVGHTPTSADDGGSAATDAR
ncbi:hypothetical protein ACIODS_27950 [Micromonospora chalcea]|uniref:hypothetical protein n=1 Tax=Micromonospora chalcea TaxID=1874 RepID=UPI00382139C2